MCSEGALSGLEQERIYSAGKLSVQPDASNSRCDEPGAASRLASLWNVHGEIGPDLDSRG